MGFLKNGWERKAAWAGLIGLTIAWLSLSWFRWTDPVIDSGRELYIPWRLNEGDVLYKSFLHPFGPFSSYFKALMFHYFGTSLVTLVGVNFLLLGFLCILIFLLFREIGDFWTGYSALLIFLGIFAFGQYVTKGNYNYILPYSQEIVHGLLFSFLAFYFLSRWIKRPSILSFMAVIGLWTLVLLTKFEVFLALSSSLVTTGVIYVFYTQPSREKIWRCIRFCGAMILAAGAVAVMIGPHAQAFRTIQEAVWGRYIRIGRPVFMSPYYQHVSGFDDPIGNLRLVLLSALWYVIVLAALVSVSTRISHIKKKWLRLLILGLLSAMVVISMYFWSWSWIWLVFRGLPLFLMVMLIVLMWNLFKRPRQPQQMVKTFMTIALAVFSLSLLFKTILNVHVWHYGFVLAMPGALLLGALFVHYAPLWGKDRGCDPKIIFVLALAILVAIIIGHMKWSSHFYQRANYKIGTGEDSFLAPDAYYHSGSAIIQGASEWLEKSTMPSDTVMVIPKGCMINYLSRRRNPTPYLELTPLTVWEQGEGQIINTLLERKPDYIIIIDIDMSQFGAKLFGKHYGQNIYQWIFQNYVVVYNFNMTAVIMKRRN